MSDLPVQFRAALDRLGIRDGGAVLAVSGGSDSMALLALAADVASDRGLALVVAHFDHGIAAESAQVADLVRRHAERIGLAFVVHRANLGGPASETEARRVRLAWLEQTADQVGASWILTAHHRDDQVETVLMRVLEGSGPAGLAGIPARRGRWIRPLLDVGRDDLRSFVADRQLEVWQDPSNADPRHYRNWLRGVVLPDLRRRRPHVDRNLLQLSRAATEGRAAWEALIDELPGLNFRPEPAGVSVAVGPLSGYSSAVVRGVLRALGLRLGLRIGDREVARVQVLIEQGISGQVVDLRGGAVAQLDFDRLRLFRSVGHLQDYDRALPSPHGMVSVPGWLFEVSADVVPDRLPRGGWTTWVAWSPKLRIRPWRAGDRIRPIGGVGRRLVVRCMQESRVSRYRRSGWPVLVHGDDVIWVPGVCRSDADLPSRRNGVRIDVRSS